MMSAIKAAAARLHDAQVSHRPCAPVRDLIGTDDIATAYEVQETLTRQRLAIGARLAGRKIGLTSAAVQRQLGVDQPDFGMLFADMEVPDGERVPSGRLIQPRAEAEVAFMLGRDLLSEAPSWTDVIRAIDFAVCAIEIVDSRITGWDIRITDTVADNASSGLYVLGNNARRIDELELGICGMVARTNDQVVSLGVGAACLGHPLRAVQWLANAMAKRGRPLKAGDVVLSGALGPMTPLSAGDHYHVEIQHLGTVGIFL